MKLLRAADCRRMPWKNGGGETVEIAVFPEGAGLAAFDWRVSRATVAADGPFSPFPGIDRTLVVLDGAGLVLTVGGSDSTLSPASPPHAFPGDLPASARLHAGPVTDLNVMTDRARCTHRLARTTFEGTLAVRAAGLATLVVAVSSGLACAGDRLERFDALLLEDGETIRLGSSGGHPATIVEIAIHEARDPAPTPSVRPIPSVQSRRSRR